ncbi:hypothetical protein BD779DRAFT_1473118 [Infundibulicybe gibba]|nr:hypothetical protein BD779DRAFT_1473118 [Infundibulicybe gibba]
MPHMRRHEPALLGILALTPHLRRLKLDDSRPYAPALTAVVICALHPLPPPSASLCPCLQRLDLFLVSDCPDGLYTAMLRARWGTQAHANRHRYSNYPTRVSGVGAHQLQGWVHDRDQADMRELHAKGMRGVIYLRDPK